MTLSEPILRLLCSVQLALLGHVTPNLRAVYAFVENEIYGVIFYYDNPLSENEEELASLADTEFIANFPYGCETTSAIKIVPYPNPIPEKGHCVYKRYEKHD